MKNLAFAFLLALLIPPVQFSGAAPAPIVEYQFDEGSGSTALNTGALGSGTNGQIFGATYSTDTPFGMGYSIHLDGDTDFVRVQDTFDYTNQVTIEAWVKPEAVDGQRIIWDDYGNPGVDLFVQDGQLGFGLSTEANPGPGVAVYDGGSISGGQWQHVAVIYDGAQIKLYINGIHTGGVYYTSGNIIDNSTYYAAIGADNQVGSAVEFKGMIDDFRIYNFALDPKELANGYFATIPATLNVTSYVITKNNRSGRTTTQMRGTILDLPALNVVNGGTVQSRISIELFGVADDGGDVIMSDDVTLTVTDTPKTLDLRQ